MQARLRLRQIVAQGGYVVQHFVMGAEPIERLAKIDADALRLAEGQFAAVALGHEMAEQHCDVAETVRLELDPAELGDDLGGFTVIAGERGEGQRRQELGRRGLSSPRQA
ncbi:hypothetical protein AUC69_12215 [Methyloceanibacter superfactus]|uniref:Uncharacterized protein n=1 Tax=Methyloceanibacter superfactus TaxID=1774969 RepID=A0A1E3VV17_9HYPH|nr:hypothetical protein [Methyloceanibacter superfactus]ODR97373.1 hypothetical protein AUC69_12215 [Methyloceanibacter superfactus]